MSRACSSTLDATSGLGRKPAIRRLIGLLVCGCVFGATCGVAAARPAAATGSSQSGVMDGFFEGFQSGAGVGSDVNGVSAGQSLSGSKGWGFSLGNADSSASQTNPEVTVDTSGTGVDLTNSSEFSFQYQYGSNDPNASVVSIACPDPSASSETCPPPGATLPPGGTINIGTGPGLPATFTTGYDSARAVGAAGTVVGGDSPVTVSVTLRDARYPPGQGGSSIFVRTMQDNVDENQPVTVTMNGTPIPLCNPPTFGSPSVCANKPTFAAFQHTSPGASHPATCNSVVMSVVGAPATDSGGAPIHYQFGFEENEQDASGCPTGIPGVTISASPTPSAAANPTPCSASGTTCSATFSVSGLGKVTASVDSVSGQQVTGFNQAQGDSYNVSYGASTAPNPPKHATATMVASSTSPDGSATTSLGNGANKITATGAGQGVLTLSSFGSDPVSSPPIGANGEYFDVETAGGSQFGTVTITDCDLKGGDGLVWWNGSAWQTVAPESPPTGSPPCVTATLGPSSSPTLEQLGGTPFAVVRGPIVTVLSKVLTIERGGHPTVRLSCAHTACKGAISLIEQTFKKHGNKLKLVKTMVLGKAAYSIAAGRRATETIALTQAGTSAVRGASRTHPLHAVLTITVQRGNTLSIPVVVI